MRYAARVLFVLFLALPVFGQLESRVYTYTNTPPDVVERTIRRFVPLDHRIKMNAMRRQVMVVADPATHSQIAEFLKRMDQPVPRIQLWIRIGEAIKTVEIIDGQLITIPLTNVPDPELVENARRLLPRDLRDLPVQGAALEVHAKVLRDNPAAVRLRVTPAVVYGLTPPYTPVRYSQYSSDMLLTRDAYLSLQHQLGTQKIYQPFFRKRSQTQQTIESFDVLLALDGLRYPREDEPDEQKRQDSQP